MSYREEALAFECIGEVLIGVLSSPTQAGGGPSAADVGVVIIVGGPQYRAGSHRQFTLLARALAAAGYPVLRFDYRGMGDSTGPQRDFDAVTADIGAAIDVLQQRRPAVTRVVLWGLCDGASAALLYLHATRDARVCGMALANPWVRSEAGLARTHLKHYYLQRLMQPEFWQKALSGQVAGKAAADLWHNLGRSLFPSRGSDAGCTDTSPRAPFQQRMAQAAIDFHGRLLLIISGSDLTAKEFLEHVRAEARWQDALDSDRASRCEFEHGDHTFTNREDLHALVRSTANWLLGLDKRLPAQHLSAAAERT